MGYKTIKKAGTLTGLVVSLLIIIGIFSTFYLYLNENAESAGISEDLYGDTSTYNYSYAYLQNASNTTTSKIDDIKNNLDNIKEADDSFQVAWNGLKGLGNILLLPLAFLSAAIDILVALNHAVSAVIPTPILLLIMAGITIVVIFLILSVLKGDEKL